MHRPIKKIVTVLTFVSTFYCGGLTAAAAGDYTVRLGDSLWKIAGQHSTTIEQLKSLNNLTGDTIHVGQTLKITGQAAATPAARTPASAAVVSRGAYPGTVYTVQPGDNPYLIAQSHGVTWEALLTANGLGENDLIYPGQALTIPGAGAAASAPAAKPASSDTPAAVTVKAGSGELVDWYSEGQNLLKSGIILTIWDIGTQKQFRMKVLCAGSHSDVETLTKQDTSTMLQIFGKWQWSPRPVLIMVNNRHIAGSLSGQPHDISTITDNGVDGHFDLYLYNSGPNGSGISPSYVQEHRNAVMKAAQKI